MTAMSGVNAKVYLLWFVQERAEGEDVELLIGVYDTEVAAAAAIDRLRNKPGFVDFPAGFQVHSREVGQDSWTEGFTVTD
jgi:hypothetical protein